jgi:hypothetical protein
MLSVTYKNVVIVVMLSLMLSVVTPIFDRQALQNRVRGKDEDGIPLGTNFELYQPFCLSLGTVFLNRIKKSYKRQTL